MKSKFFRRPSVSQLSKNLLSSFLSILVLGLNQGGNGLLRKKMTFSDFFLWNVKTLLHPQITFESFQTFSELSSQWSSQKYCFGFLSLWFVTIFSRKFKVHHCTLWINWKVRDRRDRHITIYIMRKPYMESLMAPSHLTLSDLEGHSQGHSNFDALYPLMQLHVPFSDLQRFISRSLRF